MSRTLTLKRTKRNLLVLASMAAGIVACAPLREAEAPPTEAASTARVEPGALPAPGRYVIEPGAGYATIRVYRAGPLAALGHNHVITTAAIEGTIDVGSDPSQSDASLKLAVESLAVDTPESRAAAGPDFSSVPTETDIAGTRANMLGPRVLNAAQFPRLEVGVTVDGVEAGVAALRLLVNVAGYQSEFPVSATINTVGEDLEIQSTFTVTHETLGLAPFSVMGGALRVADVIQIEVTVRAHRA